MRSIITCVVCLCLLSCGGCCGFGREFQAALNQAMLELTPVIVVDEALSGAEQVVLQTQGPQPELVPWFAGARIARFATWSGLAPVFPPMQGRLLVGAVKGLFHSLWDFLCWLNSAPEDQAARIVRA